MPVPFILGLFLLVAVTSPGVVIDLTSGERLSNTFSYTGGVLNVEGRPPMVATEVAKILYGLPGIATGTNVSSQALVVNVAENASTSISHGEVQPIELASQASLFRAKFPDAGGITLRDDNRWEYHADGTWTVFVHVVILIMKEDHLAYANQVFGFKEGRERVNFKRARCIHSDGTIFDADPATVKITKPQNSPGIFVNYLTASLQIPAVELGSLIELEIEIDSYNPYHREFFFPLNYFRSTDPVFSSRLMVEVPSGKSIFWEARNFPQGKEAPTESVVRGNKLYEWEMREVPPHVAEPSEPRGADALPYVQCALFEGWDKINDWINGYWKKNTTPSPELASLTRSLTAGLSGDDEKIAKVFHWIQKNIRYIIIKDDAATVYGSYPAWETVKKQFGCCVDKAIVLSAMLNALEIKNGPLLINVMSQDMSPRIANLNITHSISRVTRANGEKFYLDSTGYDFRYPSLPTMDQGRYCLDPFDRSFDMIPLQKPEMNQHHLISTMTLALDGTLSVFSRKEYSGETEADSRGAMKNLKPAEREKMLSSRINTYGEGSVLTSLETKNLEDVEKPYTYTFSYRIPSYSREIADLAVFKIPGLMDTVGFPETALATRSFPIEYDALEMDCQDGVLHIAPEYRIRSLPDPVNVITPYFSFEGRYDRDGEHEIAYKTVFKRLAKRVPLADYPKFKDDLDRIKRFGRGRIFLTRPLSEAFTKGE